MRWAVLLVLILLVAPIVEAAAGIKVPSKEARTITFSPGASYEYEFYANGNDYLEVVIGGDLAEYATLEDPNPNGGPRFIKLYLTLPNELDAGQYFVWAEVREGIPEGGTMGGRAAARGTIKVRSLYDYPHLELRTTVRDTGFNQSTEATLTLRSWSTVPIDPIMLTVEVLKDDRVLLTVPAGRIRLEPDMGDEIVVPLATESLEPGTYQVRGRAEFAYQEEESIANLRVGTLDVTLRDYTRELTVGSVQRFVFTAASNWNQPVQGVYGTVSLAGNTERTPSIDLIPFGEGDLSTYLDVKEALPGTSSGSITLHYNDEEQEFPIQVALVAPVVQEPESSGINPVFILYIALILLVLINIIILLWRSKRR